MYTRILILAIVGTIPLQQPVRPVREPVQLLLAVTPEVRAQYASSQALTSAVQEASGILAPHLGRPLHVVDTVQWRDAGRWSSPRGKLLALLRAVPRGNADIVVGITQAAAPASRLQRGGQRTRGTANYSEAYAVILLQDEPLAYLGEIFAHELAHLFGAVHRTGEDLLMDARITGTRVDPLNAELLALHAQRGFDRSRFPLPESSRDRVRALYLQALEEENDLDARLLLARLDTEERRFDEALASLEEALDEHEQDVAVMVELGIVYRRSHRYELAVEMYDRVLERYPDAYNIHFNRGIALRQMGDVDGAVRAYERSASLAPHYVPALSNLAEVYAELGRIDDALLAAERALAVDPDFPMALANLAYAQYVAGDIDAARATAERLLAAQADSASAYNTLGMIAADEGKLQAARAAFEEASELDPTYAFARLNLAQLELRLGRTRAAEEEVAQALELRPRSAKAHTILGRIYLADGRPGDAVAAFEQAVRLDPDGYRTLAELGYAYLLAGDLQQARECTEKALAHEPDLAWAWVNLGVVSAREGDMAEAESRYRRAIEVDPEYAEAYVNLGHVRLGLGDLDAAGSLYRQALEISAAGGLVHNNLANIYYRRGDIESAWQHAAKALGMGFELHPEFAAALEAATGRRLPRRGPGLSITQSLQVGTIDFYGFRKVAEEEALKVLGLEVGGPAPQSTAELEEKLESIPGVVKAHLATICCNKGKLSVYIGIQEGVARGFAYHELPRSELALPQEIVDSFEEFMSALMEAVRQGDSGDDTSQGHRLADDPAARALQERFIVHAEQYLNQLREVLRNSADAYQRTIAAKVIGYAPDKGRVVEDLLYGMRDPDDDVRNAAMSSLGAIAALAQREPELGIQIAPDSFMEMLNSVVWSDRNKGMFVLLGLTEGRDAAMVLST